MPDGQAGQSAAFAPNLPDGKQSISWLHELVSAIR
jgi:hypothetical protein